MAALRTIYILFFLSGISSLIFEVVWTRLLLRSLGANVVSTACVLSAFMAGLAIGAFIAQKKFKYVAGVIAWGRAELICGLAGILLPWLLSGSRLEAISQCVAASNTAAPLMRFLLSFFVLLIPTTAMGASYPFVIRALSQTNKPTQEQFVSSNSRAPMLYSINLTGAMFGALFGGFLLLPAFGVFLTSVVAAGINFVLFIFTLALSRTGRNAVHAEESSCTPPSLQTGLANIEEASRGQSAVPVNGIIVAISAAALMLLEVVWSRMFASVFGSSVYSNGIVFCMVLGGLATGAWLVTRSRKQMTMFSLLSVASTVSMSTAFGYSLLPTAMLMIAKLVAPLHLNSDFSFILIRVILAFPLVFPSCAVSGMILPRAIHAQDAQFAAQLYAYSCVGAAGGAMLFGAAVVPALVMYSSNVIYASVTLASAMLLFGGLLALGRASNSDSSSGRSGAAVAVCVFAFSALVLFLFNHTGTNYQLGQAAGLAYYTPDELAKSGKSVLRPDLLFYKEGLNSTIAVTKAGNTLALRSNGKVEATLPLDCMHLAPGSDISTHTLLGALPALLQESPRRALVIGYGSGITCDALLCISSIEQVTVAELEESVLQARQALAASCRQFFPSTFDVAPTFVLNDGRFVLASSSDRLDIVVCQAAEPRTAGAADLYTREFWQLVKSRLTNNGICAQWLQLYAMPAPRVLDVLRTFRSVFPRCMICHAPGAGEVILLGASECANVNKTRLDQKIAAFGRRSPALALSGVTTAADLLALIKRDWSSIDQSRTDQLLLDSSTTLEFSSGIQLAPPEELISTNYNAILQQPPQSNSCALLSADAASNRLLSEVALSLRGMSEIGALGAAADLHTARTYSEEAAGNLQCPQTIWNRQVVLYGGDAASQQCSQALVEKPIDSISADDRLAIAQILFLQLQRTGLGKPMLQAASSGSSFGQGAGSKVNNLRAGIMDKNELLSSLSLELVKDSADAAPLDKVSGAREKLSDALLLHGWLSENLPLRMREFRRALDQRPWWPTALQACALSAESDIAKEKFCRQLLTVDPWNQLAHILMTKYLLARGDYSQARAHAVDFAMLTGKGDGFIMSLIKDPEHRNLVWPLFRRYASHDPRLAELSKIENDATLLHKLLAQMGSDVQKQQAESGVSGYKKLGLP